MIMSKVVNIINFSNNKQLDKLKDYRNQMNMYLILEK